MTSKTSVVSVGVFIDNRTPSCARAPVAATGALYERYLVAQDAYVVRSWPR